MRLFKSQILQRKLVWTSDAFTGQNASIPAEYFQVRMGSAFSAPYEMKADGARIIGSLWRGHTSLCALRQLKNKKRTQDSQNLCNVDPKNTTHPVLIANFILYLSPNICLETYFRSVLKQECYRSGACKGRLLLFLKHSTERNKTATKHICTKLSYPTSPHRPLQIQDK